MAENRLDERLTHKKTLTAFEYKKDFNSSEGPKKTFKVHFSDGYKAEFCPLIGSAEEKLLPTLIQKEVFIKVKFAGNFTDEIQFVKGVPEGVVERGPEAKVQMTNMNGHPATISLLAAKDLFIAKHNGKMEKAEAVVSEVLEYADDIYDWLLSKTSIN